MLEKSCIQSWKAHYVIFDLTQHKVKLVRLLFTTSSAFLISQFLQYNIVLVWRIPHMKSQDFWPKILFVSWCYRISSWSNSCLIAVIFSWPEYLWDFVLLCRPMPRISGIQMEVFLSLDIKDHKLEHQIYWGQRKKLNCCGPELHLLELLPNNFDQDILICDIFRRWPDWNHHACLYCLNPKTGFRDWWQ